jgi:hypothetical protein
MDVLVTLYPLMHVLVTFRVYALLVYLLLL